MSKVAYSKSDIGQKIVRNKIEHISLEPQTHLSGQELNSALLYKKMFGDCVPFMLSICYYTNPICFLQ